jgi:hypothetical protein
MLLGDAILVPITEVGSVACAVGWAATCAACLVLAGKVDVPIRFSWTQKTIAGFGLLVAVAMALMKVVPLIPGHFTIYEWIALGVWIVLGAISYRNGNVRRNADEK